MYGICYFDVEIERLVAYPTEGRGEEEVDRDGKDLANSLQITKVGKRNLSQTLIIIQK